VSHGYGLVLGLFPVNVLHNIVHLLFGGLGVMAYLGAFSPVTYARVVAVAYALLAVMGLVPGLDTTFGLVPIYGADVALHAVIAAAAAYYGFAARVPARCEEGFGLRASGLGLRATRASICDGRRRAECRDRSSRQGP
jgi:hypothetical protein